MGKVGIQKSVSLDGYITGPNPNKDQPLGEGGGALFAWMMAPQLEAPKFDEKRELSDEWDSEIGGALTTTGAVIMGKRMWEMIYGPNGWVAPDGTAFPWPVFVLTHEQREPETCGITRFTYVNDGPKAALALAQQEAGDKVIGVAGANVCQQFLAAGLVDEIVVDLVPVFLGGGVRLFDNVGVDAGAFDVARSIGGNGVVHLTFTRASAA